MKTIIVLIAVLMASPVFANFYLLETTDQARQRRSAENYETYKENSYQAPLGGYSQELGSPSPRGTDRPGYDRNDFYGSNAKESLYGYRN